MKHTLTNKLFRLTLFGVVFYSIFIINVGKVMAEQTTKLSVSPVTFELKANPGDKLTNQIKVTNVSDSSLQLEIKTENIAGTGEQGQVALTAEDTKFALSNWITPSPKLFTIQSKQTQIVDFTITVPKDAEPGGHYGSILVGTVASNDVNTTGAASVQRVGSLLLVSVSGKADEQTKVKQFKARPFAGEWEERTGADGVTKTLVPKQVQAENQRYQKYFSHGPIAFDITMQNTGNIHVKPAGFVTIRNIFNRKVADLAIDQRNVFPGNNRRLTVIWPEKNLWGVYYKAQFVALYGSDSRTLTVDTTFWAFPGTVAIIIGISLLALLFLRKRILHAIRVLVKGV